LGWIEITIALKFLKSRILIVKLSTFESRIIGKGVGIKMVCVEEQGFFPYFKNCESWVGKNRKINNRVRPLFGTREYSIVSK